MLRRVVAGIDRRLRRRIQPSEDVDQRGNETEAHKDVVSECDGRSHASHNGTGHKSDQTPEEQLDDQGTFL